MELNHHAKDFLSTESLLMNGLIHIPVNLIQMSWRPISLLAMHCGLVSGLSCVKGLIFSPSKTCCGTSHTIWDMDWERKLVYELKKKHTTTYSYLTKSYSCKDQEMLYPPSMSDFFILPWRCWCFVLKILIIIFFHKSMTTTTWVQTLALYALKDKLP